MENEPSMTDRSLKEEEAFWQESAAKRSCWQCRLRNKILAYVGGTLSVAIILCVAITVGLLKSMTPAWMAKTTGVMEVEELNNLRRLADEKASFVRETLKEISADSESLHRWASSLYAQCVPGTRALRDTPKTASGDCALRLDDPPTKAACQTEGNTTQCKFIPGRASTASCSDYKSETEALCCTNNSGTWVDPDCTDGTATWWPKTGAARTVGISLRTCVPDADQESKSDLTSADGANRFDCCCKNNSKKQTATCPKGQTTYDDPNNCCNHLSWSYPGKYRTKDGLKNGEYQSILDGTGVDVDDWATLEAQSTTKDLIATAPLIAELSNMEPAFQALWHGQTLSEATYFGSVEGLMLLYPYDMCSHYANPPTTVRQKVGAPCYNQIGNKCPTMNSQTGTACHYDPRCRKWWQVGKCNKAEFGGDINLSATFEINKCEGTHRDNGKIFWQPPYLATSGLYQLSAVMPFYVGKKLLGVFGNDVSVSVLDIAINGQRECLPTNFRDASVTEEKTKACAAATEEAACAQVTGTCGSDKDTSKIHGSLLKTQEKCEADKKTWTALEKPTGIEGCIWEIKDRISENGYVYVLDTNGRMMFHKHSVFLDVDENGATTADERGNWQVGLEGWSAEEKKTWETDVLEALYKKKPCDCEDKEDKSDCENCTVHYMRNGEKWWASWKQAGIGNLIVIATIPDSDIQKPARLVTDQIDLGIIIAIVVFVVIGTLIILAIFFTAKSFASRITGPVKKLGELCQNIVDGDLDGDVNPEDYSSFDVLQLKKAFKGMIVGLRFGSDEYRKGNLQKAEQSYDDALKLYTKLENKRGIGISKNNLASVYMQTNRLEKSEKFYEDAIANAKEMMEMTSEDGETLDEEEITQWQKTYSDRHGNYAALRLMKKEYTLAEKYLLKALDIDRNIENFIGFAIKTATLGKVYEQMGRQGNAEEAYKQAEGLITDEVVQEQEEEGGVHAIEFAVARQHVLVNMGDLMVKKNDLTGAKQKYTDALENYALIDKNVQKRALMGLSQIYKEDGQVDVQDDIDAIIKDLFGAGAQTAHAGPRDIALILDYSGSMSGGKHRAAMTNLKKIFDTHINADDSVMFIHFSSNVNVDFKLTKKEGNEDWIHKTFDRLTMPGGGTAFYDAVDAARKEMETSQNSQNQQWVIALTDGDDNRSTLTLEEVKQNMAGSNIQGLLTIAVGGDVSSAPALESLSKETPEGKLIKAGASAEDIDAAFTQAIQVVNAHVVLESM